MGWGRVLVGSRRVFPLLLRSNGIMNDVPWRLWLVGYATLSQHYLLGKSTVITRCCVVAAVRTIPACSVNDTLERRQGNGRLCPWSFHGSLLPMRLKKANFKAMLNGDVGGALGRGNGVNINPARNRPMATRAFPARSSYNRDCGTNRVRLFFSCDQRSPSQLPGGDFAIVRT